MRYVLATALLLAATPVTADTYSLTLGAFGITGTITTDGKLGALDPADITGWSITLSYPTAPWFPSFTLTPVNSFQGSNFGAALFTDASGLHWNFSANDSEFLDIQVRAEDVCNCWLVLQTNYASSPYVLRYDGWAGGEQAYLMPSSTLIGTPVPEPATWAMMLLGFLGLGYIGRYRVREVRSA